MSNFVSHIETQSDTISSGTSVSDGVFAQGKHPLGVILPGTLDNTSLEVQVSYDDGGTWHDVFDEGGSQISITASDTGLNLLSLSEARPLEHVRLSGASNETSDRSFTWIFGT